MSTEILGFFQGQERALPLYERLEALILEQIPDVKIKVTKTQISFSNRRGFAFVSFLPVRKAKDRPETYLTVTFGLGYRKDAPRIDGAVESYPNRWTHHVMVSSLQEIDGELMGWVREAAAFSAAK
ncbi:MAG: DUF5655 domain-containing protein [Bacillota bacterium]|nr:DUF5655 domain-containing protein [Bacillota bacterium]